MIRQRKKIANAYFAFEENLKYLDFVYDEMRERLRNMYAMRKTTLTEADVKREIEMRTKGKTLRAAVNYLSGRPNELDVKARIDHQFSMNRARVLAEEIISYEETLQGVVKERKEEKEELYSYKETYKEAVRDLEEYIKTREDIKVTLKEYFDLQRMVRLYIEVCQRGNAYYEEMKEVERRIQGSVRLSNKRLGQKPDFEVHLQTAYTEQAKKWTNNAERLQLEFVAQARTLAFYTDEKFQEAGKIAYSPYLFGATAQKLLTQRKGDEFAALLEEAKDQLAEQLLDWESKKQQVIVESNAMADALGLRI